MQRKVEIVFNCPVDIDNMPNCEGGKFCTQCKKNVIDYRNKENSELPLDEGCGRFTIYQVHKPFNNWKDHFIHAAQSLNEKRFKWRFINKLAMAIGISCLFIAGCARNSGYCGGYGQAPSQIKKPTIQKASKQANTENLNR